jgi:hypothetical protein
LLSKRPVVRTSSIEGRAYEEFMAGNQLTTAWQATVW